MLKQQVLVTMNYSHGGDQAAVPNPFAPERVEYDNSLPDPIGVPSKESILGNIKDMAGVAPKVVPEEVASRSDVRKEKRTDRKEARKEKRATNKAERKSKRQDNKNKRKENRESRKYGNKENLRRNASLQKVQE